MYYGTLYQIFADDAEISGLNTHFLRALQLSTRPLPTEEVTLGYL